MIVCSCNALSDKTIRNCLSPGPECPYTPAQVYRCLGCSPQCGRCARTIRDIMEAALPSVHGACTARCNDQCPLAAAHDSPSAAVAMTETTEILATADPVGPLAIRQRTGA